MANHHLGRIVQQFTQQAKGFSKGSPLTDARALGRVVHDVKEGDTVLDVGCGPGIVACAAAERGAKTVVGLDATPAMLDLARARAKEKGLLDSRVKLVAGDVYSLPFEAQSFDVVVSRFLIHHLERPVDAIKEMARVAKRSVVLVDVTPSAEHAQSLNELELLRDHSHVKFYTQLELFQLLKESKAFSLSMKSESYRVPSLLKDWLARSFFQSEVEAAEFRRRIQEDVDLEDPAWQRLDLGLEKLEGGEVSWSHMCSIIRADKKQ